MHADSTYPNRTQPAVDIHDIRALTATGAITLPVVAAPGSGSRSRSTGEDAAPTA
jgi:hypothetical protein